MSSSAAPHKTTLGSDGCRRTELPGGCGCSSGSRSLPEAWRQGVLWRPSQGDARGSASPRQGAARSPRSRGRASSGSTAPECVPHTAVAPLRMGSDACLSLPARWSHFTCICEDYDAFCL